MPSDSAIHALAGAAGGIVAMSATYPLIFLSTRAAVETKKEQKTTFEAVRDILKREGFMGLYSGLNSSLLGIAVTNGVYYYFYEGSRDLILKARTGSKGLSALESMLAGLIAGSATTVISNPIWVVQTTQAVYSMSKTPTAPGPDASAPAPAPRPGILQTIQHILAQDGLTAFWRGIGPALVLVVNPIIQYTVFEQLKNFLVKGRTERLRAGGAKGAVAVLSDLDYFLLGALSKLVATGSTYPYIVVKNRLQAGHAGAQHYKSPLDGVKTIVKEEGVEGLYKGVGSKLTQSVLTAAILFAGQKRVYEIVKKLVLPSNSSISRTR
ncbi:mitochondrial carrier [Epithele typhae]|uniref:mitochondrial carrier n=1 Tax=Epithele typhae TaxID=378194 RepID=UPI0020088070|nr:mitochondrial carrier [Epithele typhae]KAH9939240.1 mitochondrial carrier [Epithele typhae]